MKSRKPGLRTVDVARQAGYSVQQIRNLEHDGVLPSSVRSAAGYRSYTGQHVQAALAYRALAAAVGPVQAKAIMRSADSAWPELIDEAHARLHTERQELRLARQAAAAIAQEPVHDPRPSDAMNITELAGALGLRPSTLRHWESEGLISATRIMGQRTYSPGEVRDVRIVHQLRLAGYRIPQLQALMPQLRQAGRWAEVSSALAAREASLNSRSRHLIDGAALLIALSSRAP